MNIRNASIAMQNIQTFVPAQLFTLDYFNDPSRFDPSCIQPHNRDPVSKGVRLCSMADLLQLLTPFLLDSRA